MRPAIDPANLRRQSHAYKVTRWWVQRVVWYGTFLIALFVLASIHTLIFQLEGATP